MRWKPVLLLGPLVPVSGCNLFQLASYNLINEPVTRHDERKLDRRLADESRATFQEVCRQFQGRTFTPEFADGFTDGYVDYLQHGGVPTPVAVPPVRYRRSNYMTPHGHALVRDYLAGFGYGAEVALATGQRQFLTVPVLLPEPAPDVPLAVTRLPAPPDTSADGPKPAPLIPDPVGPMKPAPEVPADPPPVPRPLGTPDPAKPADGAIPAVPPPNLPEPPADPLPVPSGTPPTGLPIIPKTEIPINIGVRPTAGTAPRLPVMPPVTLPSPADWPVRPPVADVPPPRPPVADPGR